MRKRQITFAAVVILAGCSRASQTATPAPQAEAPEPMKATVWTSKGELFLEYPALIAGRKERFAIHLTRLADFKAVRNAACEVHLAGEIFACDASTHPGIFGANVQPKSAGVAGLSIRVTGPELSETFEVGQVKIAGDAASAEKPGETKEEVIAFSKEQQWALDFATALVEERVLRDNLRVAAETLPSTGGEAAVIAPLAGRLVAERTFPVGTPIEKGKELAGIVPLTPAVADLTGLQLAEAELNVAVEQARRDSARAERLLASGAVPARRAEEARAVEATARARLLAAQARLAQYDAGRTANASEGGVRRVAVRAPISGIVSQSELISGSNVEAGKILARIIDTDTLYVSGVVPESEFGKLRQLSGAEVEMPDTAEIRRANRLVFVGRMVDSATRTVPVTYELDNRDHRLAVNQTVFLRLLLTPAGKTPVVPEAAIIDDAGRPVVFVQQAGETFQRRPVKLGIRNSGVVQLLEGIAPGDRVVTRGAYLIRLSTMSNSVPAHGHVH